MLSERLLEFELSEEEFCRACKVIVRSFLNGEKKYQEKYIDRVVTVFDFVHFKNMMVKRNIEMELEAIEGLKAMGVTNISPNTKECSIHPQVAIEAKQCQYHDSQNEKKTSNEESNSISRNEKDFDHDTHVKTCVTKLQYDDPCDTKKPREKKNERQQLMNKMCDSSKNCPIKSIQDSCSDSVYRNAEKCDGNERFPYARKHDKKLKCSRRPVLTPPKPPPRKFPVRKNK